MMDIRDKDAAKYWGNRASTYGEQYGQNMGTNRLKVNRKVRLMLKGISLNKQVLELGCGTGIFTREFARYYPNMTATDISEEMVAVAQRKNPNVKIMVMDARKPIPQKYDVILATYLFQHTDTVQCLKTIHDALTENGVLLALVPNIANPLHYARARFGLTRKLLKETSHSIDYNRLEWYFMLKNCGFIGEVTPIEFTSPYIPVKYADIMMGISNVMEHIPIVREFAGTLMIRACKQ